MDSLIHLLLLLLLPPLLPGVINKTKALVAGRRGPPVLQLYYDLFKLLRKGVVLSDTTTWVFLAAPLVVLATTFGAGLLLPFANAAAPLSFTGDFVLFVALFGLGRFFLTLAALDTGSSFEGMGAAREVTFACLTEPALFIVLLTLAKLSGALNLGAMLQAPRLDLSAAVSAPLVLLAAGLFIVLLAENCRIPVDDPNTHLELTMIHEVMVLDHSGPLLGLIMYASSLKLFILSALLLHIAAPFTTGGVAGDWLAFTGLLLVMAVVIGVVESIMARLQMLHVPRLLIAANLLCGFSFVMLMR